MGLCKIALRQRERLAVLRPRHGVIVLQTLMWRDEVREPGDLGPSAPFTDRELQLAAAPVRTHRRRDAADGGRIPAHAGATGGCQDCGKRSAGAADAAACRRPHGRP
ncbi:MULTISPECIES: Ku protein [Streptomyces]|uniref:Ku protein n=1 Tax=Streptomyces TaxID=1883 RepID=UPI0036AF3AD9